MIQDTIVAKDVVEKKDVCGGAPVLEGTRIRISDIVIEYEHKGLSPEEIATHFPTISIVDIFGALKYYYEHPKKIRDEIENRERIFREQKAKNDKNPS